MITLVLGLALRGIWHASSEELGGSGGDEAAPDQPGEEAAAKQAAAKQAAAKQAAAKQAARASAGKAAAPKAAAPKEAVATKTAIESRAEAARRTADEERLVADDARADAKAKGLSAAAVQGEADAKRVKAATLRSDADTKRGKATTLRETAEARQLEAATLRAEAAKVAGSGAKDSPSVKEADERAKGAEAAAGEADAAADVAEASAVKAETLAGSAERDAESASELAAATAKEARHQSAIAKRAEADAQAAEAAAVAAERDVDSDCEARVARISDKFLKRQEGRSCRADRRKLRHQLRDERVEAIENGIPETSLIRRLDPMREARCATAFCFGPLNKWAVEPMADLPTGATFALPASSLAKFVNGNDLSVTFTAGLRFWMFWDWISVDLHISKPIYPAEKTLRVKGSSFEYSVKHVRRLLPGIGIGIAHDFLWIGVDYDQLRNATDAAEADPAFMPGDAISGAFVFTVGIAPIATARNMFGAIKSKKEAKEAQAAKEAAQEVPTAAAENPPGTTKLENAPPATEPTGTEDEADQAALNVAGTGLATRSPVLPATALSLGNPLIFGHVR